MDKEIMENTQVLNNPVIIPAEKPKKKYNYTKKPGRPSKIGLIQDEFNVAKGLARTGHTFEEIMDITGVADRTIYRWLQDNDDFRQAIKDGKKSSIKRMENSLFHRGIGYSHEDEVIFQFQGQVVRAKTIKHYPPDTAAAFIWLKNVDPENWRDRQELDMIMRSFKHEEFQHTKSNELLEKANEIATELVRKRAALTKN